MYQAFQSLERGIETREIPLGARSNNLQQTIDIARAFMYDSDVSGTYVVDYEQQTPRGPVAIWHSRYEKKNSPHYEKNYTKRIIKEAV